METTMRKLLNVLALLSTVGAPAIGEAFASGEKTGNSARVELNTSAGRANAQDLRTVESRPDGAAKRRKAGKNGSLIGQTRDRPAERPDQPFAGCILMQSPASPNFGACNTM
jgi:hypothetical protein